MARGSESPRWRLLHRLITGVGIVLLFALDVLSQSIFTVAGGGPNGDGFDALDASLSRPSDVAYDAEGNLYIADTGNHRVRRVDAETGVITTYAGGGTSGLGDGGPATEAELRAPVSLAFDAAENLYVMQPDLGRIRRIDRETKAISTAFSGGSFGLAFDAEGFLYVADPPVVRRIDLGIRSSTIVAGTPGTVGWTGDGGPATEATLVNPRDVALDEEGNLYIADRGSGLAPGGLRKVDASTGIISTVVRSDPDQVCFPPSGLEFHDGDLYVAAWTRVFTLDLESGDQTLVAGAPCQLGYSGDGGSALDARFAQAESLTVTSAGEPVIVDHAAHRIRHVTEVSGIIETIVGNGNFGDGGPATAARFNGPFDVAGDSKGNLFVADTQNSRIRRIDAETGEISTWVDVGPLQFFFTQPVSVAVDSDDSVFVAVPGMSTVFRVDPVTRELQPFAGGGSIEPPFDGQLATDVEIPNIDVRIAFGPDRDLYISAMREDFDAGMFVAQVFRVDRESGTISTFAGTGSEGDSGDGVPATEARLRGVGDIGIDSSGNVYIADSNSALRRVDAGTGLIDTIFSPCPKCNAIAILPSDDVLVAEEFGRVFRIDPDTGDASRIVGDPNRSSGFSGDGGPAGLARVGSIPGLFADDDGNVFLADEPNNRIRAVYACVDVDPTTLLTPADGTIDLPTNPTLTWEPVDDAFRYDVLLTPEGGEGRTVATDLTATTFTPPNLEEGRRYFWRVRAKGDPFCEPASETLSPVFSFTTIPPCEPPPRAVLTSPSEGFVVEDFSATLVWNAVPRVGSYEVYLGTTNPPPLLRSTAATSLTTPRLITGNTYYWSVTAHASCDPTLTTPSEVRSFFLAGPCNPAGEFELVDPADGAGNIPTKTTLRWTASENATSYDLFLGTTNPPSIFLPKMQGTAVTIEGLDPVRTYWWKVRANIACEDAKSRTSPVQSFTTRDDCKRPGGSNITFTPPGAVGVGQTYSITWSAAPDLDPGGTYVVERSLEADFSTILDAQELTSTSATFLAETPGLHYHRVRPVSRCNPSLTGPSSSSAMVEIVAESANIIFTVEPSAVVSRLGRNLEDLETAFTIENISSEPVQVVMGRNEIQSVPFFQIIDPAGGSSVQTILPPREPKTYVLKFSGPPNDVAASYQGFVVANATGSPIIPYAFVNLKVGDRSGGSPEFRVAGTPSEYAFFPGVNDDTNRPPITVEIHNQGTMPMELGVEIGPEVWLEPEPGWNDLPIPPGATREVELSARRDFALAGSALPRYTYFTLRTRTGDAARMLVQDNGAPATTKGRSVPLEPNVRSLIVPEVLSELVGDVTLVSKIRLTNLGSDPVQAELVFTPSGVDGFTSSASRAVIIVPPNDVTTLTDPLVQVFGQPRPSAGQIEVRGAEEKLGLLSVESTVVNEDRADASFVRIPTLQRHDGARAGSPHQIAGVTTDATRTTKLVLAETSGSDGATVALTLYDSTGAAVGSGSVAVERYGHMRIDDLVSTLGGTTPFEDGRITLTVTEGGGSVAGLAKIESVARTHASVLLSEPLSEGVASNRIAWSKRRPRNDVTTTLVAPYVVSGDVAGTGVEYATVMGFQAPGGTPLEFTARLTSAGQTLEKTLVVPAGAIIRHANVISDLFGIVGPADGSVVVFSGPRGRVYGRIEAGGIPAGTIDLISSASELVSMAGSARPLYVDGVEQSTDPERGSRWNLYVREIAGASGTITVRLYEAGNRTHPIAIRDFAIGPNERLELETIFAAMELDSESRRKDRTNVLCVVTPKSGSAQITAVAVEIDNVTGVATPHTLKPASGLDPSGVTTGLVRVVDFPSSNTRRRPVDRPD